MKQQIARHAIKLLPARKVLAILALAAVLLAHAPFAHGMDCPQAYYARWTNGISSSSNFFPIAVWLQEPAYYATAYKNAGINLFIGLADGPNQSQLTGLTSAGLPALCDQTGFALSNLNNRAMAGWTQVDEPDNAQSDGHGGYGPPIDPSVIIQRYNSFRSNDLSRPVFLGLGQGVAWDGWYGRGVRTGHAEDYTQYVKGCDIASFDIYPVNASDAAVSSNLWYVALGIDRLRAATLDAKPVWCWIECTSISSAAKPTPAQVKAEVWMALVHGANGFGYFCHSFYPSFDSVALLHDATMLAAVTALNQQVQSLAPVLNSRTVTNEVTVSSTNATPIDILVKHYGGAIYVFATAMRSQATTGTFTLPTRGTIDVIGESRQIQAGSGTFTDAFASYGVHLYKFTPADANGNGMSDAWEQWNFNSTNSVNGAAGADYDHDGSANLNEYIAGTDPTNRNSRFAVNLAISNGQMVVSFMGLQTTTNFYAGLTRHYAIECKTDLLSGTWSAVPPYTNMPGSNQSIVLTNQMPGAHRFFRARAWLE